MTFDETSKEIQILLNFNQHIAATTLQHRDEIKKEQFHFKYCCLPECYNTISNYKRIPNNYQEFVSQVFEKHTTQAEA